MATPVPEKSIRAQIAERAINDALPSPFRLTPGLPEPDGPLKSLQVKSDPNLKVGIIGAGAAGLCAGMILQRLGRKFEILEASDHVGGRMFTYSFSDPPKEYDYFDVGAMRFPYIPGMYPTFDVVDWVGATSKMIPYYFKSDNTVHYYNDKRGVTGPFADDYFDVGVMNGGTVPQQVANQDAGTFLDGVFAPIAKKVASMEFEQAWTTVIKPLDVFSTRAYLATSTEISGYAPPGNQAAITWLETNGFGTNMYDQSFVEAIMDYLEFGIPYPQINVENAKNTGIPRPPAQFGYEDDKWYCLLGGTHVLSDAMYSMLDPADVKMNKQVTQIAVATDINGGVVVNVAGEGPTTYYHVISTMSLGCLQTVDLTGASLSYEQKTSIRCAHYSDSTKVGIKWKTRWWEQLGIKGGQSYTDRPTRTVVFPSYGINVPGAPAVMIACYNWSQDASRFGCLIKGKDTREETALLDTIIEDIAVMHNIPLKDLQGQYVDHFAWDWQNYEYTRGAFALFNPGQFYEMFPSITRPAGEGLLHFAGEATSVHHAWIAGAIASAYRAVAEILIAEGNTPDQAEAILTKALTENGKLLLRQPEEVNMELYGRQLLFGSLTGKEAFDRS